MKNLDEEQRKMRERNSRARAEGRTIQAKAVSAEKDDSELEALKKRVSALEAENAALRQQITAFRQGSDRPVKSYEQQRREQQHNLFKYSNVRRY
jgi:predicted RNase H-like nuclease (RuvC/YqgF family)